MATSRRKLILAAAVAGMAAIAMAQQQPHRQLSVTLGENAYELQQRTGFSMGYPTSSGDAATSGGSAQHVDVTIALGALTIGCDGAYLYLTHDVDIFDSGRLFCPVADGPTEIAALRDRIDATRDWDKRTDHTQNPRRADEYGKDITAAYRYLSSTPMRGTVLAVPLYSWLDDSGLFLELNAVRHVDLDAVLSYEMNFSWYPICMSSLIAERLQDGTAPDDDAARAGRMQRRAAEQCDQLPQSYPASETIR
ncbi:MAG: hypothetical protein ACK5NL_16935 [Vibrio fluvialis]